MLALLSAATASNDRTSRLAFWLSRKRMRSVAMRPGSTMLAVMPSRPTSRARVLDQPTSDSRNAFDMPRLGIGATTPDDVLVMMRPNFLARMPGSTRSVMAITDSTMLWKNLLHCSAGWLEAGVGGGP